MRIIKHSIIDSVTLYLLSLVITGISFQKGYETILLTGFVLALSQLIVKPVINLLLLPINLITFNLFKWVSYAVTLYLVTLVVPGFEVTGFSFQGFENDWLPLPAVNFDGSIGFILLSFVISIISSIIYWLMK